MLELQSELAETRWRRGGTAGRIFDPHAAKPLTGKQRLMVGAGPRNNMTTAVLARTAASHHRGGVARARKERSALAAGVEAHYESSMDRMRVLTNDPRGRALARTSKQRLKESDERLLQRLCEIGARTSQHNSARAVRLAHAERVVRRRDTAKRRQMESRVRVAANKTNRSRYAKVQSAYDAKHTEAEYDALAAVRHRLTHRPVEPRAARPPRVFDGCSHIDGAQQRMREVRGTMDASRRRYRAAVASVPRRTTRRRPDADGEAFAPFVGAALPAYDAAADPHCGYADTRQFWAARSTAERAARVESAMRIAQYRLPAPGRTPAVAPFDLRALGVRRRERDVGASGVERAVPPVGLAKLLYQACVRGLGDRALWLLQRGAGVAYVHAINGRTPLHAACCAGLEEVALAMLEEFGADVGARDGGGVGTELPIGTPVEANFKSKGRWLPANVVAVNRRSALETMRATVVKAKADEATAHLSIGSSFGQSASPDEEAARAAIAATSPDGVAFLLAATYDLRFDDGDRERAVDRARMRVVLPDAILYAGGCTPLHYAAARGMGGFIARAVGHWGADVNARNVDGHTAMMAARGFGHEDLAQRLEAMATMDNHRRLGGKFASVL